MKIYFEPITSAFIIFPILAFLITLPYIIYNYKKYGSIPFIRTTIFYSFVLYLLTIYFLVILPLPSIDSVLNITSDKMQLIPFNFIDDFNKQLSFYSISEYFKSLNNPIIRQILLNVAMFIPLGIYSRYYFKLDLKKILLTSFVLSLFFELTQLTGLYFIYPRSYRVFDVDDLILNTMGGYIGYLITPYLTALIPSREKIDKISYERGTKVNIIRRLVAIMIDAAIYILITLLINIFLNNFVISYLLMVILATITLVVSKGYSLGKFLVSVRVLSLSKYMLLFRHLLLYLVFIPMPVYISLIYDNMGNNLVNVIITTIIIIFMFILYFIYIYSIIESILTGSKVIYERLSNTEIVSTIKINGNVAKLYLNIDTTTVKDTKKLNSLLINLLDVDNISRLDLSIINEEKEVVEVLYNKIKPYIKNKNINFDNFLHKEINNTLKSGGLKVDEIKKDIELNNYDYIYFSDKNEDIINEIKELENTIVIKANNIVDFNKQLNKYLKR